nr:unnamed protein product [Callosobruchus analis]
MHLGPRAVHDSRIWRNYGVYNIMQQNTHNTLFLGDSGYGLTPWLMTPYRDAVTSEQNTYNRYLIRERLRIERCFGKQTQHFLMLHHKILVKTENIPSLALSCFILHNGAKYLHDEDFPILEDISNNEYDAFWLVDYDEAVLCLLCYKL